MDFDFDDMPSTPGSGQAGPFGGKRQKPPKVKVPWSTAHFLALGIGVFAAVCIGYAVVVGVIR